MRPRRQYAGQVCLVLGLVTSCSLKSLDHLQSGEPRSDAPTAGTASIRGGAAGEIGGRNGQPNGGAGTSLSPTAGIGGASASATTTMATAGATATATAVDANGGATSTESVAAGAGGASSQSNGGTGTESRGGDANGGAPTSSAGGATASGGLPVSGGATTQLAAGATGGSGGVTAAGAGRAATTTSAAGTTAAGTSGNAGSPTAAGGFKAMTYNVPSQSCADGVMCPSSVSCCTQIEVPAGSFPMGTSTDPNRNTDEYPQHTANLDRFLMDKFEVTVGRFRRFVEAFDGTMPPTNWGAHPKVENSGWQVGFEAYMPASASALTDAVNCSSGQYQTWTNSAGIRESMPMNCVSWYVAMAFCIWDGGRLPTEAEWEMAAASGANDWRFPWGSTDPDPAVNAVMNCLGDGTSNCAPTDLVAVGSRPLGANQWGHLDLAGSLWEWTVDYYDSTYYQTISACNNCANVSKTTPRVIRGGSFTSTANAVRASARASKVPLTVDPYTGFRCVRSP